MWGVSTPPPQGFWGPRVKPDPPPPHSIRPHHPAPALAARSLGVEWKGRLSPPPHPQKKGLQGGGGPHSTTAGF